MGMLGFAKRQGFISPAQCRLTCLLQCRQEEECKVFPCCVGYLDFAGQAKQSLSGNKRSGISNRTAVSRSVEHDFLYPPEQSM